MWLAYLGSWMITCLGKSCSSRLPRVPFVNCCQFMHLVISLFVWGLIVSVPDHCLSFYFSLECMFNRGSTAGFPLLQCTRGVVRHPTPKGSPGFGRNTLCLSSPHLCFIIVFILSSIVQNFSPIIYYRSQLSRNFLSVAGPTGIQLLVFLCSSVPVVLFDTPGISRCRSQV